MGMLDGFLHIVVGNGIGTPPVLNHQMVTETAVVNNDTMVR